MTGILQQVEKSLPENQMAINQENDVNHNQGDNIA